MTSYSASASVGLEAADPGGWFRLLHSRQAMRLLTICGVVALIALHAVLGASSVLHKSATFDEPAYIAAGYSQWTFGDYRLMPENGVLPELWMALPLRAMGLKFPDRTSEAWKHSNEWHIGPQFLFASGNNADAVVFGARMMILGVSCLLGLVVFLASRRWFGTAGGFVSLILYVLSPTILANGRLATSDLMAAATMTIAMLLAWAMMHRLNWWTLLGGGAALAAVMLSKFSGPILLPMILILLVIRLARRMPLKIRLRPIWTGRMAGRWRQAATLIVALIIQGVIVVVLIWAAFGFRFSAFAPSSGSDNQFYAAWEPMLQGIGFPGKVIEFARNLHLLPQAYLYGATFVFSHAQERRAFLDGSYSLTGWWYFFPYAFAVKTALASMALMVLAAAAWRLGRVRRLLYKTAPCWIFIIVYGLLLMSSHLNIGLRHMLPIYPMLFILSGAAGWWLFNRKKVMRWAVGIALAALAAESLLIWPSYLSFFNALAGGPSQGYRHLADSSVDWGQDLPALHQWLVENKLSGSGGHAAVYLSYFGTASPTYYGISAWRLDSNFPIDAAPQPVDRPLTQGYYCISASMLDSVYSQYWGHWCRPYEQKYREAVKFFSYYLKIKDNPKALASFVQQFGQERLDRLLLAHDHLRFARLCAYLRQREPDAMAGYSILIYAVSPEELHKALFGPPAELYDRSVWEENRPGQ